MFWFVVVHFQSQEPHGKFDAKSYISIFLGYSTNSSAFCVYHQHTKFIGASVNVFFYDTVVEELEK